MPGGNSRNRHARSRPTILAPGMEKRVKLPLLSQDSKVRLGVFGRLVLVCGIRSSRSEPSMTTGDPQTVSQLALQLRLVTDDQVRECWDEIDAAARTPDAF